MRWCTAMRTRWSIGTSSLRTSFLASVASWRSQTLAGRFTRRHWGELTTDQPKGLTLKNTIEGLGLVRLLFMKNSDVVHLHGEGLVAMLWSWVKEEYSPKRGGRGARGGDDKSKHPVCICRCLKVVNEKGCEYTTNQNLLVLQTSPQLFLWKILPEQGLFGR